mgnify:CR=1 FL=1
MPTIAGFTATGRKLIGPASDLYELEDADGLKHTAIIFHEKWCAHPAITDALGVIKGYLESPLVTGLVELTGHVPDQGAFLYPTGKVWSVAEIVQALADRGERGGIRAGLELMYTAGQILSEGSEAGESQGVYSHGGLTPRRVVVKSDGQVMVVGYGLPQVEILEYHADRQQVPDEDSFRYCPPERLESRPEDVSSDLFGLSLIAFEVMTGKPVYDGLVNDIRQQAARGEGSRRLFRFREVLPEPVRDLLTKALRPDAGSRYLSGEDFLSDVHSLLSDRKVPGPSLLDLMEELQSDKRRVGGVMQQGRTQMVAVDELREQLEKDEGNQQEALGQTSDVWRPANRKRTAPRGRASEPAAELPPAEVLPTEAPVAEVTSPTEEAPTMEAAAPDVSALLRSAPPKETPVSEPEQVWGKANRRVRRVRRAEQAEDLSVPQPIDVNEPEQEMTPPPRGRRVARGSTSRDAAVPAPPTISRDAAVPAPPTIPSRQTDRSLQSHEDGESRQVVELPPTVPKSAHNPPTADDLLLQIRGRTGEAPSLKLSDQSTAIFQKEEPMEVVVGSNDDDESATVMMTPDQLRAKLAAEVDEAPRPKKTPLAQAKKNTGTLCLQLVLPDGREVSEIVPVDAHAAAAITSVVGRALPLPLDQSGTLQSWYRLEHDGVRLGPTAPLAEYATQPLHVVAVHGDTKVVEIAVVSSGQDVRFSNPLSTVVPVSSLIAHLQQWLTLPAAHWEMVFDGEVLDPHMILDDISVEGSLSVHLRIAGS